MAEPTQLRPFDSVPEAARDSDIDAVEGASLNDEARQRVAPRSRPTRPSKSLPTERIKFPRQLDAIRAFAAASGQQRNPVTLAEVAELVKLASNTLSLATLFFVDAGFLTKTDGGRFIPTDASFDFARAYDWNKDTASRRLAAALEQTWFADAIRKRLSVQGSLPIQDAVEALATDAGASIAYRPQVRLLLDYLEAAGIVVRDGQVLRTSRHEMREHVPAQLTHSPPASEPEPRRATITTTASQQPEGVIAFSVAIRVDVTELSSWSPDRIAAFFAGLAQVVAAKNGVETGMLGS